MLLLSQILAAGVAFFVNILAASTLLPTERGELALVLQIAYMLTVAALLGGERPFVAANEGTFREMLTKFLVVIRPGWLVSLIPALASVYFYFDDQVELAVTCGLIFVFFSTNTFVRALRVAYIASGTSFHFLVSTAAIQIGLLLAAITLWLLDVGGLNFWLSAYALTGLIAVFVASSQYNRTVASAFSGTLELREVRHRGLRLLPASFGNTAMLRSDRLLLPMLASSAQLGIYVVVATVMEIATWPIQQWVDASLRKWSVADMQSRTTIARLLFHSGLIVAGLSVVFGGIAYLVVDIYLPDAYRASKELILPLGISAVFYGMSRVQQGILVAQGKSAMVSVVELSGLAASVLLYIALIPSLGAFGASLGSLIGYGFCFVVGLIALASSMKAVNS